MAHLPLYLIYSPTADPSCRDGNTEIMKKNQRCAKFKLETLERKLSKAFVELWVESSVTSWTDSYGRVYRNNIEKSELCKIFNYEEKSPMCEIQVWNGLEI